MHEILAYYLKYFYDSLVIKIYVIQPSISLKISFFHTFLENMNVTWAHVCLPVAAYTFQVFHFSLHSSSSLPLSLSLSPDIYYLLLFCFCFSFSSSSFFELLLLLLVMKLVVFFSFLFFMFPPFSFFFLLLFILYHVWFFEAFNFGSTPRPSLVFQEYQEEASQNQKHRYAVRVLAVSYISFPKTQFLHLKKH